MRKIQEYLDPLEECTLDEFWAVIDALPDQDDSKKHKDNIRKYFKKDGTPKAKALSPSTQNDYQSIYDTEVFIHTTVIKEIHLNKVRKHVAAHKQHTRDVLDGKIEKHKIVKWGKLVPIKKRKKEKVLPQKEVINPVALRHQLVVEYNRLIREGNPDTKKLREQINDEIQKIESETESESDVTS